MPGAVLMRVRIPGAARDLLFSFFSFSLTASAFSATSLTVFEKPPTPLSRVQMHASTEVRMLNIPNTVSNTNCLDTGKYHTL